MAIVTSGCGASSFSGGSKNDKATKKEQKLQLRQLLP